MKGSIFKANQFHSLKIVFTPEEVAYLCGKHIGLQEPKMMTEGNINDGLIIKFDTIGANLKHQRSGAWDASLNVARVGAASISVPQQPVPYQSMIDDNGIPYFKLPPQPDLGEGFNRLPFPESMTTGKPHEASEPEAVSTPKYLAPLRRKKLPTDDEVRTSVIGRAKTFWSEHFDILHLKISDDDIWNIYQAHKQPEFGKFLDIIKRENDAITEIPIPTTDDKISDLKTAVEMINNLLEDIGHSVVIKVYDNKLVAKRIKMIEEEI